MRKLLLAATAILTMLAGPAFAQSQEMAPGVYNIEVISVRGNLLSIRVEGESGRRHYRVPPDFTFDIDGNDIIYSQLVPKQKLRAYVSPKMIAPSDYVVEDETIIIAVVTESPVQEEVVAIVMPATAGFLPMAGLAGLLLFGLGFVARRLRR